VCVCVCVCVSACVLEEIGKVVAEGFTLIASQSNNREILC